MLFILNRLYNDTEEQGDMEWGVGTDAAVSPVENISLRGCVAFAGYGNKNSLNETEGEVEFANRGMLAGVGFTLKTKIGALNIDLKTSTSKDAEIDESRDVDLYSDTKFGFKPHKAFTIMPRVRTFTTLYGDANTALKQHTEIRPELIFIGTF
jgi:hypothetical protein